MSDKQGKTDTNNTKPEKAVPEKAIPEKTNTEKEEASALDTKSRLQLAIEGIEEIKTKYAAINETLKILEASVVENRNMLHYIGKSVDKIGAVNYMDTLNTLSTKIDKNDNAISGLAANLNTVFKSIDVLTLRTQAVKELTWFGRVKQYALNLFVSAVVLGAFVSIYHLVSLVRYWFSK